MHRIEKLVIRSWYIQNNYNESFAFLHWEYNIQILIIQILADQSSRACELQ